MATWAVVVMVVGRRPIHGHGNVFMNDDWGRPGIGWRDGCDRWNLGLLHRIEDPVADTLFVKRDDVASGEG